MRVRSCAQLCVKLTAPPLGVQGKGYGIIASQRARVRACMRASVRACECACVRACLLFVRVCDQCILINFCFFRRVAATTVEADAPQRLVSETASEDDKQRLKEIYDAMVRCSGKKLEACFLELYKGMQWRGVAEKIEALFRDICR